MQSGKRGRGRPKGTCLDDRPTLRAVADLLLSEPSLRPTTAMKRVKPKLTQAETRRLQAKWKLSADALMAEAKERAVRDRVRSTSARAPSNLGAMAEFTRAVRALQDDPITRAVRDAQNSPAMKAMREFHDSPAMRAIREYQNSPMMRAMREFQESPMMRALRDQQKILDQLRGPFKPE